MRSGRTVQPPSRLIEEMGGIQITNQVAGIGAGIGGGFENTNELRVMTYQEACYKNKFFNVDCESHA